jgi:hypothetical protein
MDTAADVDSGSGQGVGMKGRLISLGLVVTLAVGVPPAQAQRKYNPGDVQDQIDRSSRLQQEAIESLNDSARAEQLIREAYRELSSAQSAMVINASSLKFPDPLLDLNTQKAHEALRLMQRAEDLIKTREPSSEPYLAEVRRNLERSLRLTRLMLAL